VPATLKAFTAFFRLGDAILVVAFILSLLLVVGIKDTEFRSYLMNVSASFLFASIVRGVELYREIFRQIDFIRFFGTRIAKNEFFVIYPEFSLDIKIKDLAKANCIHQQQLFVKNNRRNSTDDMFRIDLESCAASNDLRAMIELSSLFAKRIHEPTKITPDSDWERILEESFVSVGFTSNYITHKWLGLAKEHIVAVQDTPHTRYREFINLKVMKNNAVSNVEYRSSEKEGEIGIIVKFRPDPDDRPDIIWFLCAGVGGDATVGSAIFLSRKWGKLLKIFGQDDFILVIRTAPGVAMHASPIYAVKNKQTVAIGPLK
jgi:hypothetical protein